MTTPLSGTGAAATTASGAATGAGTAGFDKDTFMKLLVAQLKYQNPMQPQDNNQYMSQMAVFAQVEKLGQLVTAQQDAQTWQQRLAAESLVGRQVTGTGADDRVHSGVVTSVGLGNGAPTLTLTDGSSLTLADITTVAQAPAP